LLASLIEQGFDVAGVREIPSADESAGLGHAYGAIVTQIMGEKPIPIVPVAEGAALATQTRVLALVYSGIYDLLPNRPLAERMQAHLERIGVPSFSEEEQAFARELQSNFGVDPQGMATTTTPLPADEPAFGFSTDVGDVSWCTPTMGCGMPTVPLEVGLHTWAATACHGTSTKGKPYVSPLGPEMERPLEIPDWVLQEVGD
jgi:hypothetical protein